MHCSALDAVGTWTSDWHSDYIKVVKVCCEEVGLTCVKLVLNFSLAMFYDGLLRAARRRLAPPKNSTERPSLLTPKVLNLSQAPENG